ncbi:hypothetical protein ACO0LG_06360 [Undibacterium sp. Ji42W]|uniref:hypothetical protein n=1 Tax=Undibacterium sp. Ji42W TaxID=3413039 RepID=UPI003BF21905
MCTTELTLPWQARPGLQSGLILFHHQMSDIVRTGNNCQNENGGRQRGSGDTPPNLKDYIKLGLTIETNKNIRVGTGL